MEQICKPEECTGCSLCASRCPKQCITMTEGLLGHLYPKIDQSLCIDCKLCQRGCPSLHHVTSSYPLVGYAAWAKDMEDYRSSTSGAMASVLSSYIIEQGGVVYGCSVLPRIKISHIRVDKAEDLYKLKGSKYVQSSILAVLPQIRTDIKSGMKVLFIGTPCQVAAVKNMYRNQPENLFLVDLICHGTPSNAFLKKYLEKDRLIQAEQVVSIKFRTPDAFSLVVLGKNKELYRSPNLWTNRYKDLYYNTFIDGYTYRKSCFSCPYAKSERVSDITIGDFWGLGAEKSCNIPEHKYGISAVLPMTEKGQKLVDAVKDKINIYQRTPEEAIMGNDQLRHPKHMDKRIEIFQRFATLGNIAVLYPLLNLDKIVKYKLRKHLRK